ncbi:uncharacterized protein [Euwallacea similis]|uniref:uncharacterized protein isoform X2 n=1 Tax=Euwallacea similis TaxID=1736056 RepID=UPI00344E7A60
MKLYTQIILSTYVFLPAICILLSPTLIMGLAKAQQQKAKLMADALTARAKAATALARNNVKYLHKRLVPNTKFSSDLNTHNTPFNLKRAKRQALQMPMESQRLRSDLAQSRSHLNQEAESMTTLQNLWNMNNFGMLPNFGDSMRHVRREEPHNEIPTNENPRLNDEKRSGAFFTGRNVFDNIVNQENPFNNNEGDYIENNETFDESPNDFVDPFSSEDFSERTSKKLKKKKKSHSKPFSQGYYYSDGYYGRSSDNPVMIMENPEGSPLNPQLIQSMEARKSKKGHSRGHGSSNSYYGRESDLLETMTSGEPILRNEFNTHTEERSPTKKSKKNKGHSGSYYYFGRTGEGLLQNDEQTSLDPELITPMEARKSKKGHSHSHGNFNSYYGRESDLPEEMIPSDPTLMTPLWDESGDMEARTHGKKSKKKRGKSGRYDKNRESMLELETPTDPQVMATIKERKSKKDHSRGHGNSNYYYSRQGDFSKEIIPNQQNLMVNFGNEENVQSEFRSQYHPSEYYARNNDEVAVGIPLQVPIIQDSLTVVPENKAQIDTIPPPPQNSNMAMVGTDPQTHMRAPQDPILASQADPRCKEEDESEKYHEYYTPPMMPQIMDPNEYYQHTMEEVEKLNKKMAEATKSLLYHPKDDTFHIPSGVSSYMGPAIPHYLDEIPQITPYDEKSANPHHHHRGFSHTHTHTLTHSHGHISNENIGNGFAHTGTYANTFSHSKPKGFGPTRGLAEAQSTAGNGFHGYRGGFNQAEAEAKSLANQGGGFNGYGGGFSQAETQSNALANHGSGFNGHGGGFSQTEAQAKALANHGSGFNGYGGGFSHANAQAKALSGGGLNPVGPIGGGFNQAEAQSKGQSGIGFGQYTDGFAQAGASSQGLGFGQSQANAQAISQSANNGFGQAASQALAQASSGAQAAPQFFQVLGPSSFVNAHARDATPFQRFPLPHMTHEMEAGKTRFSRAYGSENGVFDGLNIASGIVNSALGLGSMLQSRQGDLSGREMSGNQKETMSFVKNSVDSNIQAGGNDVENEKSIGGNEKSFDPLEGSEMRIKRESSSKQEGLNQNEQEGVLERLNLASGIVHSALDLSSRMKPNEEETRNKNQANSLGENAYFPSGNLAPSLVHSVINPTMSKLTTNKEKLGIVDALEKTMNPALPSTNPENQEIPNFASDVAHSVLSPNLRPELKEPLTVAHKSHSPDNKSLLPLNTYHSHIESQFSDPQHISTIVKPEDFSLRSNTGNTKVTLKTNLESLKTKSEDAQFRKRNIDSKEHDNLTSMINPDDISVEEVRTETSLIEPSDEAKIKNNNEKPMQNNSSLMSHINNTQLLSNVNQEMHKTQLADHISGIESNDDHISSFTDSPHTIISTANKLEGTTNQDHKDKIVGMPLPRLEETVTDITSILEGKSPVKPDSSEESSEEKTKIDRQKNFSKPSTISTLDNTVQSGPVPTMTPAQIENIQFTIPDEEEQFTKAENITEPLVTNATNTEAITKKNTTGVLAVNEGQSRDKDNSTNFLGNFDDIMNLLSEDQNKEGKELIADILRNNLDHDRILKPEQLQNPKESQSHQTVTSPHLFQAKSNNFHEDWERIHQEYARKSRAPVEKVLETILGAQREKVSQIQKDATGDDDLLMISFIGDGIIKDLQNRKELAATDEKITSRRKRGVPDVIPITQLLVDPNARIDVPKTFDNMGAVLRHTFESPKAPLYHVRNMLGNTKNTVMSAVKIPPSNVIIPSLYEITQVPDQSPQLGAINEEMLRTRGEEAFPIKSPNEGSLGIIDTFQKLGGMVKESVNNGKNVVLHATDIVNDARQALYTKPSRLFEQKQILATETSYPALPLENKSVILAPKLLNFQKDAIGVSKPELSDRRLHKIVLEPTPSGLFRVMAVNPNQETEIDEVKETLESLNEAEQSVGAKNLKDFFSKMHQEMKEILTSQQEERKRKRDEKLRSSKAKLMASSKDYLLGKKKISAKSAKPSPSKSTIQKMFEENEKIKLPLEVLKTFTDDIPKGVDDINFEQNSVPQLSSRINSENETVGLYLVPALMTPFMGEPTQEVLNDFLRENGDNELLQRNSIDENKKTHVHPIIPLNLNVTIPQFHEGKSFNLSEYLPKVPMVNAIVEDVKKNKKYKDVDGFNRQLLHQKYPLSQAREESEGHLLGVTNPLMFERQFNESLELNSTSKTGKNLEEPAELLPVNKSAQTSRLSAHPNLTPIMAQPAETLQINKEQTQSSSTEISVIRSPELSTQNLSSIDETTKPIEKEAEPTERTSMNVAEQYKKPFLGLSSQEKIQEFLDQYNKPYIEENFQVYDPVKSTVYDGEDYNYL